MPLRWSRRRAIRSFASLRRQFLVSSLLVWAKGLPRLAIMFDPRGQSVRDGETSVTLTRKRFDGFSGTRARLEVLRIVRKFSASLFWYRNCSQQAR